MHSLVTIVLISFASAAAAATTLQSISFMALSGIVEKRDVCVPVTEPVTCERSCGAGSVQCIRFPNCYNPTKGQSCCSNGRYCAAGTYCTDRGCCDNGLSLAECGATISLSVIPPPAPESTTPATSDSTSTVPETTSSATTDYTTSTTEANSLSTYTEVTSSTATSFTDYLIFPTPTESATSTSTVSSSNTTVTYSPPAQYTGGVGRVLDTGVAYFGLGGLGALLMLL